MANKERYSVAQVEAALQKSRGLISPAAQALGCRPNTVRNYVKRHPTLAETVADQRERLLDVGEISLYRAVQNGEAWAVCFLLKTQGKGRGYVERREVSGPGGGTIRTASVAKLPPKSTAEEIREVERHVAELEEEIWRAPEDLSE